MKFHTKNLMNVREYNTFISFNERDIKESIDACKGSVLGKVLTENYLLEALSNYQTFGSILRHD